jgi:hypothetical protein
VRVPVTRWAAAGLGVVLLAGCGSDVPARFVEFEPGERELRLVTGCADDVDASVTETDDAVRIDDISGDRVEGDCLGGVRLTLREPLGARGLFVDGERWQRLQGLYCPDGRFGPAEVDPSSDCQPAP